MTVRDESDEEVTAQAASDDGKTQRALHENSEDGVDWRLSMDVTLTTVE